MRAKEIADLEPKTRAALARLANGTPIVDRWSELAASTGGPARATLELVIDDRADLDGDEALGALVELDGRRRLRLFAAVAAAIMVLGGALLALDRARPSSRPNGPGADDPRFPKEPAHLLPAGDPSTMRVSDAGTRPSITQRFTDDAGSQLYWTASPAALPDVARIAPDGSTLSRATIAGVEVTIATDLRPTQGALSVQRAGWTRGALFYTAWTFGRGAHLVDFLPSLVAGTLEQPPSPPPGFFPLPPPLDTLWSGVTIDAGRPDLDEILVWSVEQSVTASDLDDFVAAARQHPPLGSAFNPGAFEHVTVNGRAAIYAPADPAEGGSSMVLFSPLDGTMALVSSSDKAGGARAALVAIAEGLHMVDDATWDAARYGGRLLLAGTTDGTPWSVAEHGDLCTVVQPTGNPGISGRSCMFVDPGAVSTELLEHRLVAVIAPASVTHLDVSSSNAPGATIEPGARRTFSKGGTDYALWIVAPPAGVKQIDVVATDATGGSVGDRHAVVVDNS